ncbi:MAG TPA: hypothetical protein DHV63_12190 [Pseudomonas sp.]|nr:hypothetical protein [Pseudomonas sp.]
MAIDYRIVLDDEHEFSYRIELDRGYDQEMAAQAPKWTRLDHQQCNNCPLSRDDFTHCPAAVDLHRVIEDFQGLPAVKKAQVRVRTPEREYNKLVGLEEGLRALLGVIMATSACPVLGKLKPMAHQHLPFASNQEFVLRAVSLYLARQYFNLREGRHADWELRGLVRSFQQLQLVNQAFWYGPIKAGEVSNRQNGVLVSMATGTALTYSLETQLKKIRPLVMSAGEGAEMA